MAKVKKVNITVTYYISLCLKLFSSSWIQPKYKLELIRTGKVLHPSLIFVDNIRQGGTHKTL